MPKTLSRDNTKVAAMRCKEILTKYGIINVEIAFRESIVTRSAGPQLLDHASSVDPTANIGSPFTPALGLSFSYFEGTGCLYLREGGESDRVLLLTARHAVLPLTKWPNDLYYRNNNSTPRREVIHLGSKAYQTGLEAITCKIANESDMVNAYRKEITALGEALEGEDARIAKVRNALGVELAKAEVWSAESQRGMFFMPLQFPSESATNNLRKTEINRGKFDWDTFQGNIIDIGAFRYTGIDRSIARKLTPGEFMAKMYPRAETRAKFDYPVGGLMRLRDFVQDGELRQPTMLDANGLVVVKNGNSTGVTLGRISGIESRVRVYKEYGIDSTSMEIAIYPYSHEDGAFSDLGDSGSVISDAKCRIVGMLTAGGGLTESFDVSYASPYYFLDERIKKAFPNSHLYPFLA